MVHLVTSSKGELLEEEFVNMLKSLDLKADLKSVVWTVTDSLQDAVVKGDLKILYGESFITESLFGLNFRISPFSFFQPNVFSIKKLYKKVSDIIGETEKKVYDLYCGTGTISIILSKNVKEVIGVELIEEACEAANLNKN